MAACGVLLNPNGSDSETLVRNVRAAAHSIGQQIEIVDASTESEIEMAFAAMVQKGVDALLVASDVVFMSQRRQVVELAARHAMPASYFLREFVNIGGLMSCGGDLSDMYRQAGVYTGRVLNGTKPANLPVLLPTKFELVISLKTAKTLGLTVPPTLLTLADELIE